MLCHRHILLMILTMKKLLERFMKKNCKKKIKKKLILERVFKKKGDKLYMSNAKAMLIHWTEALVK